MNYEEAFFLSGCNSLEDAIDFLKKRIKNIAFITSHTQNYAVSNKEVITMKPMTDLQCLKILLRNCFTYIL